MLHQITSHSVSMSSKIRPLPGGRKINCAALADVIIEMTGNELAKIGSVPNVKIFLPTNPNTGKANLASGVYVDRKRKCCEKAGIKTDIQRFSVEGKVSSCDESQRVCCYVCTRCIFWAKIGSDKSIQFL